MSLNSLQMPIPLPLPITIPIPMACKPFNIQWFTRNGIGIGIGIGSGNGIGICKLFKHSKLQASFIKMPPRLESWKDNE